MYLFLFFNKKGGKGWLEKGESSRGWRQLQTEEEEEGGGADEQSHCEVSEKEEEWQAHGNCVYVYMRDRQNKQFNIKRENDGEKGGWMLDLFSFQGAS